jgi:hypothetical protein
MGTKSAPASVHKKKNSNGTFENKSSVTNFTSKFQQLFANEN